MNVTHPSTLEENVTSWVLCCNVSQILTEFSQFSKTKMQICAFLSTNVLQLRVTVYSAASAQTTTRTEMWHERRFSASLHTYFLHLLVLPYHNSCKMERKSSVCVYVWVCVFYAEYKILVQATEWAETLTRSSESLCTPWKPRWIYHDTVLLRYMQYLSDETSCLNCNKFLLLTFSPWLITCKKPAKLYCYYLDQPANIDVNYSVFQ